MIVLISMATVHEGRHQLSPYLMPVRYLKMTLSMPNGAQINGFAAGDITSDEKSYHFSGTDNRDRGQAFRRTDIAPKAKPDARQLSRKRVQPGS